MSENLSTSLKQSYLATRGASQFKAPENERSVAEIVALANGTDTITFNDGDFIPDFPAFNEYLNTKYRKTPAITLTKDQVKALIYNLSRQLDAHGIDHLAMKCLGKDCIKFHTCALALSSVALPIGESCPLEESEIQQHLKGFAQDFEDLPTYADKVMVYNLVSSEVIKGRVLADMGQNPDVTIQVAKGVDKGGNPIYDTVENPNQRILQNTNRTQERILKALHMTLEQKKRDQDGRKKKTDSDIMALYQKRLREFEEKKGIAPVIDAATNSRDSSTSDNNTLSTQPNFKDLEEDNGSKEIPSESNTGSGGNPKRTRGGNTGTTEDVGETVELMGRTKNRLRQLGERLKEEASGESGGDDLSGPFTGGGTEVSGDSEPGFSDSELETIF